MSESICEVRAYVREVKGRHVTVAISSMPPELQIPKIFSISAELIKCNCREAPISLITKDTEVILKYINNEFQSCTLDVKNNINCYFGTIQDIQEQSQTVEITLGIISYTMSYRQIFQINKKPIVSNKIPGLKGFPIIMYLNGDAAMEAHVIPEDWKKTFKLADFSKNYLNQEEIEYFVLTDPAFSYKIYKNSVFYEGTSELFSKDLVKNHVGVLVDVCVNNLKVFAFVKAKPPRSDSLSPYFNRLGQATSPRNINYVKQNRIPAPVFGKRLQTTVINTQMFYKENQNLHDNGLIALVLLEVCYRFANCVVRNRLFQHFFESMTQNPSNGDKQILDCIFSKCRNPSVAGELEEFYGLIIKNSLLLEYHANCFIEDPHNFTLISNTYGVCINVTDSSGSLNTFLPFNTTQPVPIIYLHLSTNLVILYTEEMMKYDGYDVTLMSYCVPEELDVNYFYYAVPKQPQYPKLFESVFNLLNIVAGKDLNDEQEILKVCKNISDALNQLDVSGEQAAVCDDFYSKIIKQRFKRQLTFQCMCGKTGDKLIVCGDHALCKECAFVSSRIGVCVTCRCQFLQQVEYEGVNCSNCEGKFEEKYYSGFFCRCILCTVCLYSCGVNKKCYKGHVLEQEEVQIAFEYLRKLGYQI